MAQPDCQEQTEASPMGRARHLLLKELGARRVAAWCNVAELTVYKWLERGTDESPIPAKHAVTIAANAKAEGLDAPIGILVPAMAEGVR